MGLKTAYASAVVSQTKIAENEIGRVGVHVLGGVSQPEIAENQIGYGVVSFGVEQLVGRARLVDRDEVGVNFDQKAE